MKGYRFYEEFDNSYKKRMKRGSGNVLALDIDPKNGRPYGQSQLTWPKKLARSLFEYKGNPTSFDCTEDQLAKIIQGSVDWADQTRESFARKGGN